MLLLVSLLGVSQCVHRDVPLATRPRTYAHMCFVIRSTTMELWAMASRYIPSS